MTTYFCFFSSKIWLYCGCSDLENFTVRFEKLSKHDVPYISQAKDFNPIFCRLLNYVILVTDLTECIIVTVFVFTGEKQSVCARQINLSCLYTSQCSN